MTIRKMKRWVKIVFGLLFIFATVGVIGLIGLMIFLAFIDDQVITNAAIINRITLLLAGISLPGLIIQLLSLLTINEKKTFTLEKKCPHCKQLIELKLTED
ncbi:hypothetical protein SAMN04487895_104252 [Paenibacillus sophorae]|uniref:Uncharacterized protein n=1 Tax=Paenibacillus sophorae TaxID=1333845 RepID=A0A1H8L9Z0_9BACL|nr:hypothetical protein [Paenibacillus sophorae]QWU17365.1 hypothetical protein KP014_09535 [Paenibacillus sophorae]SEO02014.1 hypothetical protein SAMN04487895_104252 [Paenibacillus sophorae]